MDVSAIQCLCSLNLIIQTNVVIDWHRDMVKWLNKPTHRFTKLSQTYVPFGNVLLRFSLPLSNSFKREHTKHTNEASNDLKSLCKASFIIGNQIVCAHHTHTKLNCLIICKCHRSLKQFIFAILSIVFRTIAFIIYAKSETRSLVHAGTIQFVKKIPRTHIRHTQHWEPEYRQRWNNTVYENHSQLVIW